MSEIKLYYYTTIDKLALILDSRALSFTRLDLFDDMSEIKPFVEYNPLKCIFASCHTMIVEALTRDFPNIDIEDSELKNSIRETK